MSLISHISDYDKIIALIEEFTPKWLYIQPFVLGKLLDDYMRLNKKNPLIKKRIT